MNSISTSQKYIDTQGQIGDEINVNCKICLGDELPFLFPCNCSGSVGIHEECFIRWIQHMRQNRSTKISSKTGKFLQIECQICHSLIDFEVEAEIQCTKKTAWFLLYQFMPLLILLLLIGAGIYFSVMTKDIWPFLLPIILLVVCCFFGIMLLTIESIKKFMRCEGHIKKLKFNNEQI